MRENNNMPRKSKDIAFFLTLPARKYHKFVKQRLRFESKKSCYVGWITLTPLAENPEALQNFLQALRKILQCL